MDEINRFLVTACPDLLADGGMVTLQFRRCLSVLQVIASVSPGHAIAAPEGDSISLDSVSSSKAKIENADYLNKPQAHQHNVLKSSK